MNHKNGRQIGMRKKKIALYIALAGLASLVILGMAYAQDDMLWLEHDIFVGRERPGVAFPHALHADELGLDCLECHHIYENGENVWDESEEVQKCSECHSPTENQGKVKKLKIAFHRNCKSCHRMLTKEGMSEDAPYRKCSDCHEKK